MLQEPSNSQYDLNFSFLGFPVRIAWGFWVAAAVIGWDWSSALARNEDSPGAPVILLIWAAVMLVSILVHELGHSLAMRYYGLSSRIVLYHFGGLAIPESFTSWRGARQPRIGPREQIVISIAGPGIQLIFGATAWAIAVALHIWLDETQTLDGWLGTSLAHGAQQSSTVVYAFFSSLVWINMWWAIFNLAPILPLDGGQITRNSLLLTHVDQPERVAYLVSVVAGAAIALWCLSRNQVGVGLMFLFFTANNWQAMQGSHRGY